MVAPAKASDGASETAGNRARSWLVPSLFHVVLALTLAAGVAGFVLWLAWDDTLEANTLQYEVAKTCLQVLGVVVLGGVIAMAAAALEERRRVRSADLEHQRRQLVAAAELQREAFAIRTQLLDQTARCAQEMYVTCQYVRRVIGTSDGKAKAAALALLDQRYLAFSAESQALETELGARFAIRGAAASGDDPLDPGEAWLRWHQVGDLLTVYYFNLTGSFPGRSGLDVLTTNSRGFPGADGMPALHSGLELKPMVKDLREPAEQELVDMRNQIRPAYSKALPLLARAILDEPLREL